MSIQIGNTEFNGGYVGVIPIQALFMGGTKLWPLTVEVGDVFTQPSSSFYFYDMEIKDNIGVSEDGSIYVIGSATANLDGTDVLEVRKFTPGGNPEGDTIGSTFGDKWCLGSAYRPSVNAAGDWTSYSTTRTWNHFPEIKFISANKIYVILCQADTASSEYGWLHLYKWDGSTWTLITSRLNNFDNGANLNKWLYNVGPAYNYRTLFFEIDTANNRVICAHQKNNGAGSSAGSPLGGDVCLSTYSLTDGSRTMVENLGSWQGYNSEVSTLFLYRDPNNSDIIYITVYGNAPSGYSNNRRIIYILEYSISGQSFTPLSRPNGSGGYYPSFREFYSDSCGTTQNSVNIIEYVSQMYKYNGDLYAFGSILYNYIGGASTSNGPNVFYWMKWDSVNSKWVTAGYNSNYFQQFRTLGAATWAANGGQGLITPLGNSHAVVALKSIVNPTNGDWHIFNAANYAYINGLASGSSKGYLGENYYGGTAPDYRWPLYIASGNLATGSGSKFSPINVSGSTDTSYNSGYLEAYLDGNYNVKVLQSKDPTLTGFTAGLSLSTYKVASSSLIE